MSSELDPNKVIEEQDSILTDSFAAGILFFKLCSGGIDPSDLKRSQEESKSKDCQLTVFDPKWFSERGFPVELHQIIENLLQKDAPKRWTIEKVL